MRRVSREIFRLTEDPPGAGMRKIVKDPDRGSADATYEASVIWDVIRSADWTQTSLGPYETWPVALRTILRTVISSRQPMCLWWGRDLLEFHNEAFVPILADRAEDALGAPFRTLWADVWDDVVPYVEEALAGRGAGAEDLPLVMTRNGRNELTHWTFNYSPLYDDAGQVAGILNVVTETTKTVAARRSQSERAGALELALDEANSALGEANVAIEQQREAARVRAVVQRELSHRLKNAYAMVQAIVSQSLRHANSMEGAAGVIGERIQALAGAQDVLTRSIGDEADIDDVVRAALAPHQETVERIEVSGPAVKLSAQRGMGLALAVHELATNAAKYGGLSVDGGLARASWSHDGELFMFQWAEAGGPSVSAPRRRGFGSRLLERVIPSYFGGTGRIDYGAEGVRYVLEGKFSNGVQASA